jgi:hypothetical protein
MTKIVPNTRDARTVLIRISAFLAVMTAGSTAFAADDPPNACPVDGCAVTIAGVAKAGEEIELTFASNFTPDVSKNHFHVWWGKKFTIEQAGRGAKPVYGVTKGEWHRHDDYPKYVTQGAASTSVRDGTIELCVSAADRDHNIIDIKAYHCMDVSDHL